MSQVLCGQTQEALQYVDTKYVFVHQDDFVMQRNFDLVGLLDTMDKYNEIKIVRFNQHKNQDLSRSTPGKVQYNSIIYGDQYFDKESTVPLIRNFCWCDNDHITTVEYYKNFYYFNFNVRKF